jgi:hypothetical protein
MMDGVRCLGGAISCVLAMTVGGCSLVFSDVPPANHRVLRYFDCDSTRALPATDTLIAAAGAAELAFEAFRPEPGAGSVAPPPGGGPAPMGPGPIPPPASSRPTVGTLLLAAIPLVAIPVGSAVYGYRRAATCRDAKTELAGRLMASP